MFFSVNNGRTLTIGSTGNDVWALQVYLITNNILSPTGPAGNKLTNPTGYFGSLTKNALAAYQAQVGIAPTSGIAGPKTHAFLESIAGGRATTPSAATVPTGQTSPSSPSPSASLSYGSTGTAVTTLQNTLVQDGYLSEGIFSPGTFDIPTERAVETFQCIQHIACSDATPGYGTVGPKTRAALDGLSP